MLNQTIGRWTSNEPISLAEEWNPIAPIEAPRYTMAGRDFAAEEAARYAPRRPNAGDSNLYRYVHNSPTNFTDPSGMVGIQAWFGQSSAAMMLAGFPGGVSKGYDGMAPDVFAKGATDTSGCGSVKGSGVPVMPQMIPGLPQPKKPDPNAPFFDPVRNTIVADGRGGVTWQLGTGNQHFLPVLIKGIEIHERVHIEDILKLNPTAGKGLPRGQVVKFPTLQDTYATEIRAADAELNYLLGAWRQEKNAAIKFQIEGRIGTIQMYREQQLMLQRMNP